MKSRTVKDASVWQEMEGSTPVVQQINSLLTMAFIIKSNVPADECLGEAEDIAWMWHSSQESFLEKIPGYLKEGFCVSLPDGKEAFLEATIPSVVERLNKILSGG